MTFAQGQQQDTGITTRFLVAFSQSWNRFYLKSFKEPYIYDVHTEGGLVISPVFADNRHIVHFCGWRVGGKGVTESVIFCGYRKCMAPNHKQCVINSYNR